MRILTGIMVLLLSATVAQAAMYKWTDAQGNVHFGDKEPEGVEADEMVGEEPAAEVVTPEDEGEAASVTPRRCAGAVRKFRRSIVTYRQVVQTTPEVQEMTLEEREVVIGRYDNFLALDEELVADDCSDSWADYGKGFADCVNQAIDAMAVMECAELLPLASD